MEENKKENHVLRWVLSFCLFGVAFAHYQMLLDYGGHENIEQCANYLYAMGRFAVPMFFVVSGYYLYSKDGHSENSLKRKTLHILYIIILLKVALLVVYLIAFCFGKVTMDEVVTSFVYFDLTTSIVWFVYALFLIYCLFWILHIKKIDFAKTYFLIPLVIAIDLVFCNVIPVAGFTDNIVGDMTSMKIGDILYPFVSISFFILGYYIHRNKEKIDSVLSNRTLILFIVLGVVISFLEATVIIPYNNRSNLTIGTILILLGIFIGSFRVPEDRMRIPIVENFGRKYLGYYFCFFTIPSFVLTKCVYDTVSPNEFFYYFGGAIVTVLAGIILAILFGIVVDYISSKRKSQTNRFI